MREIKIRAWDKHLNDMFLVTKLFEGKAIEGIRCGKKEDYKLISHDSVLMQYTGLKDQINRNEVYEHDIINHLQYGFLKVEWDYENTGWCCFSKTYKKFSLVEILLLGGIRVGNIYENKELMESKK